MSRTVSPVVVEQRTHSGGAMTMTPNAAAPMPVAAGRLPVGWIAAGVLALSAVAAGAYYAGRGAERAPDEPVPAAAQMNTPQNNAQADAPKKAPAKPTSSARSNAAGNQAADAAPAVACPMCGVVESVTAVQRKGEGTGVGAVAGTVVGGALGNQVGGGNGRTAMTVLGAIGGAVAGNEVEKQVRAVTVYRVKVRTDGGEVRTIEQSSSPAVGQRVKVEGSRLQML